MAIKYLPITIIDFCIFSKENQQKIFTNCQVCELVRLLSYCIYIYSVIKNGSILKIRLVMVRWLLLSVVGLFSCVQESSEVVVATAANVQYPIHQIIESFQASSKVTIRPVIGSSGKLTAQILAGADFDVFISADTLYPNRLMEAQKTALPPNVYALGRLIIWSTKYDQADLWKVLKNESFDHLAIANPQIAPYGKAALEVIDHLGIYDNIQEKLVFGESIAQVNQFIHTGAADIGITASSIVHLPKFVNQGSWIPVPDSLYRPLVQSAVLIDLRKPETAWAEQFYQYLFSEEAQNILENFGYSRPQL